MSGSGKKSRLLESLSADDSALRVVTMNDVDWLMSVEVLSSTLRSDAVKQMGLPAS